MPGPPSTAANRAESRKAWSRADDYAHKRAMELVVNGGPLYMRRAKPTDFKTIEQMFDDAKDRLRELGTDQWSDDWPYRAGRGRMDRVRSSIEKKNTWIAEIRVPHDAGVIMHPVATVTTERKGSTTVWTERELRRYPAVYLGRLVVAKGFSSFDIGASITDWAGYRGLELRNARSIRIDVWTTNTALHAYYRKRGFRERGQVADKHYPAGQRFERPTSYDSGLARHVYVGSRRQPTALEMSAREGRRLVVARIDCEEPKD